MATKRKPTPAQIAARERFAAMARSGAFKRKASKSRSVSKKVDLEAWMDEYERLENENMHSENVVRLADLLGTKTDQQVTRQIVKNIQRVGYLTNDDYDRQRAIYKRLWPKVEHLYKAKRNPAKKTVSQKISQLTREGYPQKQAVAIALSEQRAGKVKRNPMQFYEVINTVTGESEGIVKAADYKLAFDVFARKNGYKNFAEMKQKEKLASNEYLMTEIKRRSNPRASNPIILVSDKAIASKRKRNPTKRANPMIKYALVPDDGGFTFGMDDRTPVQFVFSNRDKVRGVYRSFALPKSVTSSPDFQQWASSLPGQSIIVSLNDLRKMLKRYV